MQTPSNVTKRLTPQIRGAAAIATALVIAPTLWRTCTDVGRRAEGGSPLRADEALTALVAGCALLGLLWLVLGVLLGLLVQVPGGLGRRAARVAEVVTPALVRRAAGALLGVGLAAGVAPGAAVAVPVQAGVVAPSPLPDPGFGPLPDPGWGPTSRAPASSTPATPPGAGAPVPTTAPGPVPVPATSWVAPPPLVRPQPDVRVLSPAPRPDPAAGDLGEVVVRRGDSLWTIAARHLGHDVTDAEVARAWPAWFEANRPVIGDDPDLLRPGQVLRPPEEVRS